MDPYEYERRKRQRDAFEKAAADRYSSQYGLERFDKGMADNKKKMDSKYIPTNGELKQASKRQKDEDDMYEKFKAHRQKSKDNTGRIDYQKALETPFDGYTPWWATKGNEAPKQQETPKQNPSVWGKLKKKIGLGESINEETNVKMKERTFKTKSGRDGWVRVEIFNDGNSEYEFEVGDDYLSGWLLIEDGELIDYDGCFELPNAVVKTVEMMGYKSAI